MKALALLVVCGCGRLSFEELPPVGDAQPDGAEAFRCPAGPRPDPLTISGTTLRYTTFDNQYVPVGSVMVAASGPTGVPGMTTSDTSGTYALSLVGGADAGITTLTFARSGFLPTSLYLDAPLDANVAGQGQAVWSVGDGPLWTSSALDSVYTTVGATRMANVATVNVAVRDCSGNPLEGVTVTFDPLPPPATQFYLAMNGMPASSASSTIAPFTHSLALNVPPGTLHVTASAPGLRFTEITADVPGDASTLMVIHGGP